VKYLNKLTSKNPLKENLALIIDAIRGDVKSNKEENLRNVLKELKENPVLLEKISQDFYQFLLNGKLSLNLAMFGILSKSGFKNEFWNRVYEKFIPTPPQEGNLKYLLQTTFSKKDDYLWAIALPNSLWLEFFSTLLSDVENKWKLKNYIRAEFLHSIEILSIWIASEEFNEDFIRLDNTLLDRDSAFLALHREISNLLKDETKENIDLESTKLDFQHIDVLLVQSTHLIATLKKKSVHLGISVSLTYEFERLEEILGRLRFVLELIRTFDTTQFYDLLIELFKKSLETNNSKSSLKDIWNQNVKILARSITNNTSQHGEHYITETKKEYVKMIGSAAGAGVIIAFMATNKIFITSLETSVFLTTVMASLNYGFGFVLIHLCGFTVATKQPAMTASTFAEAIEKKEHKKANQQKLVELFIQVSRSQFAAVIGNVVLALLVGTLIGYFYLLENNPLLTSQKAEYYLQSLEPFPALFYAAIAGIWLFCAGLISGYFDNRANYLNLKERYFHHPILKKITTSNFRERLSIYLHENHGAIAGNFFFGILLGITPFLGYIFELPLDIRHIAFSSAYLGIGTLYTDTSFLDFLILLGFVFMIGFTNLAVSFILALKVSLRSRDAYFGSVGKFLWILLKEFKNRPKEFFFPVKKSTISEGS
jgi:site-specific recombinase